MLFHPIRRLSLLALCLCLPLSVMALQLTLTEKGVLIDAGELGKITLPAPSLTMRNDDYQGQKPALVLEDAATLLARYPSGGQLRISLHGDEIRYAVSDMPAEALTLRFVTLLPINLNQGGRYALGDVSGEFPASLGDQNIAGATTSRLDIIHALGQGIRIATPNAYQQIQDNRKWNWNTFVWIYAHNLAPSKRTFEFAFKITSFTADTVAGGSPRFLVDRFGQSTRVDYPEKVRDENELRADITRQKTALGPYVGPAQDRFGGLAGSGETYGLKKTGYFHVTRIPQNPDTHVFVTPEGNAFFQLAVCSITRNNDFTIVKGRERIYEWLPARDDPAWATAWFRQRSDTGIFSFHIANWIRKYQQPFSLEEWTGQTVERLRAWGFNSVGAFSAYPQKLRELNFPTVVHLPDLAQKGGWYLPDKLGAHLVVDPFVPGIEDALDNLYSRHVAPKANDPLIIGYFLGNEQHFENLPKVILAYKASKVHAKARLVTLLREKYGPDIASFNTAWNPATPYTSFDELGDSQLFIRTDAAAADMRAFLQLYMEAYYSMIHRVFKKHDPNHLLLGSRHTPRTANNEDVVRIAGKYNDAISVNYYTYGIEGSFLQKVHEWSGGRPILLSEWFYSSTERGLSAHVEVKNQTERALGYRNYLEQSAALGFVIGSQWFIYFDQTITGRHFEGYNGEAINTGLVDVADRPYEELVAAARVSNSRVYDIHLGQEKPFLWDDPRFSGKGSAAVKVATIPRALPGLRFDTTTTHWPGRPAIPIGADRLSYGNPNPDFNGDFRLCWDDDALHLLVEIKDPTPCKNTKQPPQYWRGDGVELFIGSKNMDQGGSLQFSDRQILIGAGETPGVHIIDHPGAGQRCRVAVVKSVAGDGYTVRVEIPWSVLDITPRAGMEFLFDIALDNSDDGEVRLQQFVWSGTERNSGDRGSWGRARLVTN